VALDHAVLLERAQTRHGVAEALVEVDVELALDLALAKPVAAHDLMDDPRADLVVVADPQALGRRDPVLADARAPGDQVLLVLREGAGDLSDRRDAEADEV